MLLQLIAAVEVLATARGCANMHAHLAMDSAMLCEVGRLGKPLATNVAFQWLVLCVRSLVDSYKVSSCASDGREVKWGSLLHALCWGNLFGQCLHFHGFCPV